VDAHNFWFLILMQMSSSAQMRRVRVDWTIRRLPSAWCYRRQTVVTRSLLQLQGSVIRCSSRVREDSYSPSSVSTSEILPSHWCTLHEATSLDVRHPLYAAIYANALSSMPATSFVCLLGMQQLPSLGLKRFGELRALLLSASTNRFPSSS
jgi:hypothetical protein